MWQRKVRVYIEQHSVVIKKILFLCLSLGLMRGMSFILIPFYTRNLTVADYGLMELCANFVAITSLIMDIGLSTYASIIFFHHSEVPVNRRISELIRVFLIWSSSVFLILTLCSPIIISCMFQGRISTQTLILLLISSLFGFFNTMLFVLMKCREEVRELSIIQTGLMLLYLSGNVLLVYYGKLGYQGVVYSLFVMNFISMLICVFRYREYFAGVFRGSEEGFFCVLRKTAPYAAIGIMSLVIYGVDRWIINVSLDTYQLGIYSLAYKLASVFDAIVLYIISVVYSPHVYKSYRDYGIIETERRNARLIKKYLLGSFVVIMSGYFILLYPFRWLVGAEFQGAYPYIFIIMMGYVFMGIGNLSSFLMYYLNKGRAILISYGVGASVNLVLLVLLIKSIGLTGAAVATVVSYVVVATIMLSYRKRILADLNQEEQ